MIANKKILKKLGYFLALIILASFMYLLLANNKTSEKNKVAVESGNKQLENNISPQEKPVENNNAKSAPETPASVPVVSAENLPAKILVDVPFTSQAPLGKWDTIHEEACEETSLLMVKYYLENKKLTPALAEKEIQDLVAYEIKTTKDAKGYADSTAKETAKLGADYYGIKNFRVVYNFVPNDLKKYLSLGRPIIVPAAGRLLGNPNFTAPGPLYHNLVLTGYDGDTIVTNDPGTRKGQNYKYSLKTLFNAIHDFPGNPKDIEKGRKAMIVLD